MSGGRGERAVASFDEDSVSMAVEAARDALRGAPAPDALLFATTSPPYAEKLNAATIAAALDLPPALRSAELGASSRIGLAALPPRQDSAAAGRPPAPSAAAGRRRLVCAADVVIGAPGGARESGGGDGASAFLLGPDAEAAARLVASASATTEVLDVWRRPEDAFAKQWEERFGAEVLGPVLQETVTRALVAARLEPTDLTAVILDATNPRAVDALPRALRLKPEQLADGLLASVGRTGAAHAGLLLARALDRAKPGERILVASLGDGCDVAVFEVTERIAAARPRHAVDGWIASKRDDLAYNAWLKWRGILP